MSTTSPASEQAETETGGVPQWKQAVYETADDQAADALGVLREDIRFCTNCFSKVRKVIPAEERVSDGEPASFITDLPVPDTAYAGDRSQKVALAPSDPANGDWSYEPKGRITIPAPISSERPAIVTAEGGQGETYYGTSCGECGEQSTGASRRPVKAATGRSYMRNLSRSLGILRDEYAAIRDADGSSALAGQERLRLKHWRHRRSDLLDAYRRVKRRRSVQDHNYDKTEFYRALRLLFAAQMLS
jgi:hypothetical protein